jgi:hypothetical protein
MYGESADPQRRKPLMICGDTGVGKSLFVTIFRKLYGKDKKVLSLNCAAFHKETIISELFGHEKGAFTDAKNQKIGLLEKADDGLLILEEIGELEKPDQAKLLTFLENGGRFYRLGGTKEIQSKVLIISTTHRASEDFRPDFWNRFFQFYVPAIFERRIDVLYYINWLYPEVLKSLTPFEFTSFLLYNWPGNVREIENVCFLIKWKDKYRFFNKPKSEDISAGYHSYGILSQTDSKYSTLSLCYHIKQWGKLTSICGNTIDQFLEKISFTSFLMEMNNVMPWTNQSFPDDLPSITHIYNHTIDIPCISRRNEFDKFRLSLMQLTIMLGHSLENPTNKDLLDIEYGDMASTTARPIRGSDWSPEECLTQKKIIQYRTATSEDISNITQPEIAQRDPNTLYMEFDISKSTLEHCVYHLKDNLVELALKKTDGNQAKAEKLLGKKKSYIANWKRNKKVE